jgi:hypothetical protein
MPGYHLKTNHDHSLSILSNSSLINHLAHLTLYSLATDSVVKISKVIVVVVSAAAAVVVVVLVVLLW